MTNRYDNKYFYNFYNKYKYKYISTILIFCLNIYCIGDTAQLSQLLYCITMIMQSIREQKVVGGEFQKSSQNGMFTQDIGYSEHICLEQ